MQGRLAPRREGRTPASPCRSSGPHLLAQAGRQPVEVVRAERVAARVDARAEHGLDPRGAQAAHGRDRGLDHPGPQAFPSGVGDARIALRAGERHRGAVGGEHRQRRPARGGYGGVGLDVPVAAPGPFDDHHPGPVHLVEHGPGQVDDGAAPASTPPCDGSLRPGRPGRIRCSAPGFRPPASTRPGARTGQGGHHSAPARCTASQPGADATSAARRGAGRTPGPDRRPHRRPPRLARAVFAGTT